MKIYIRTRRHALGPPKAFTTRSQAMEVGKRKAHWQKHGHSTWTCEYGTRAHYTINVVHLDGIRDTDMAAIEKLRQAIELIRDSVGELMS